ncbi:methylenetetrahydrofolate dehydrogenase (NADP+) / methenyltetrahydrofolate cyclohydrolase [Thermoflavifilum thermophilum]|uniref:Bifunctional protein FolD n=2 Tax=Thermoflavifilum thermophilum TaxID=1393122 RepID=A0A1I7NH40_9BACT|nr:methylenetetrahydrofolate dehydrogenase (NADP+) / methenyltetrahydrofolate cyclohydrolase [Thermoflavifilum thermophilum]
MQLLDGRIASQAIQQQLAEQWQSQRNLFRRPPHLACILVGHHPPSETYVASKIKACAQVGFQSSLIRFPETISAHELLKKIHELNADAGVDGILVQLPLPAHINEQQVIEAIDPDKDVDGFHPVNMGRLANGLPGFVPATPKGIMLLLAHYRIPTRGLHAVVIGRSHIVGTPVSLLLSRNAEPGNCTVTLCHSQTRNLPELTRQADLIVAALGRPAFLKADMVKEGVIVVDVGINRVPDTSKKSGFRLVGDVDFEQVAPRCSYITPVPGGVGPMTIAALLSNTYQAAQLHAERARSRVSS